MPERRAGAPDEASRRSSAALHMMAMPTQQRLWAQEDMPSPPRQDRVDRGQKQPVARRERRPRDVGRVLSPAKHSFARGLRALWPIRLALAGGPSSQK